MFWLAVFAEKFNERFPEADAARVHAVEDDDGLALHEVVALLMEDEEGEELLHGSSSTGEDDEGVGVLDHDFHAGVDVVAEPEAGESGGETFELDDVGDVRASGPAVSLDGATHDGSHDASFASSGDAAKFVVSEVAAKGFAISNVIIFLDGSGAEDADVAQKVIGGRGVGVGGHGLLLGKRFAVDGRKAFVAKVLERFGGSFGGVGNEEVVAVVLLDGAELIEVVEELEHDVPALVVVDDDGGLSGEVFVEGLVADEDGAGLEEVFKGGSGGEDEGVGTDDFFLNIVEGDLHISIGVVDVPACIEEVKEEFGAGGAIGVFGADDGSGKANGWHGKRLFVKGYSLLVRGISLGVSGKAKNSLNFRIMDQFLQAAIEEARVGLDAGGIPIGSVLVHEGKILGRGHNQRVQGGSPILHGEMDALEKAGRQSARVYRESVLYTTLSPCSMCSGAILLYGIPKVVVGENETFMGEEELLRSRGVEVEVVGSEECVQMMKDFIEAKPELWNEDIGV